MPASPDAARRPRPIITARRSTAPSPAPRSTWTGESSHQRLFVAAAELVRLASATTGLLLTIDDVHDADDASLRLLHYIARSTHDQRVCIVLTHRPAPMTDTLAETRQSLIDRHGATELELGPLDDDDTAALVRRHVAEPDAELVEQIVALSRGIPFAVNELARRAANEPQWVQALDANMIGGIAPATREVLQRVAVVGLVVRHRRVRRAVRAARGRGVRPPRRTPSPR